MAEHDDAAEQVATEEPADDAVTTTERPAQSWFSDRRAPIAASLVVIVVLLGVGAWLGFRVYQDRQATAQRNLYVQVARQTAINLTTINYAEVDADIKRILDSATGTFHEEFQNRSQPFVDVVKKVQSKSEGKIAEAALLSETKDHAQVLVAVAVTTTMAVAPPDPEPHRWRMKLTVDKNGDGAKVSNVEFVR